VSTAAATARPKAKAALKAARRDVERTHLVDAAERVFARRGYEGARMAEIAAEAGLALATVYGLCEGKEELYTEIHRLRGRALLERAAVASAGAGSAWQALIAGVRAYAEHLAAHPDYLRLHLLESQPWALRPRFTSRTQDALWREGLELTVAAFRAAIDEGSAVDGSPELHARLMIAAHQVFLGEWIEEGMRESPSALIERMQAYVERAFGRRRRGKA
jgi:TetR/AcrR family fatty acid metabolism transcriptional regulator